MQNYRVCHSERSKEFRSMWRGSFLALFGMAITFTKVLQTDKSAKFIVAFSRFSSFLQLKSVIYVFIS